MPYKTIINMPYKTIIVLYGNKHPFLHDTSYNVFSLVHFSSSS